MNINFVKMTFAAFLAMGVSLSATVCEARSAAPKRASSAPATRATKANPSTVKAPSAKRAATIAKGTRTLAAVSAPTSAISPGGAKNDPNRAVEIRGQSRTLSMMLVLKNGKENINFIKIRKDYNPEIASTQY